MMAQARRRVIPETGASKDSQAAPLDMRFEPARGPASRFAVPARVRRLRPIRVRSRFALTLPRREDRKRQCGRPLSGYDLPRARFMPTYCIMKLLEAPLRAEPPGPLAVSVVKNS
jgi:hypothetical protein